MIEATFAPKAFVYVLSEAPFNIRGSGFREKGMKKYEGVGKHMWEKKMNLKAKPL